MINLQNSLLVILGSAVGGGLRYILSTLIQQKSFTTFPIATFTVNIIGCFIMGIVLELADKYSNNPSSFTMLLATGFCGGFTTFSAFAYENMLLFKSHLNLLAFLYMILSLTIGIIAVKCGMTIIK